MKKAVLLSIILACGFTGTALAQKFPDYYPSEGFGETGPIDWIDLSAGKIVIDDSNYRISPNVVVRSLSSKEDSLARLRVGTNVAFKSRGGMIIEVWLLPDNYSSKRRR